MDQSGTFDNILARNTNPSSDFDPRFHKYWQWWVDGSFGVHPNTRSQTGGTASLVKGYFISTSIKQKLNTRSSPETELIAADDLMPHICWTNYFLKNQGYDIKSTVMYQDN